MESDIKSRVGCIIEILVALFIILVLVAIAIPDFLKLQPKPRNHEGKSHLGAIFTAQYYYFAEHNTYAGGPNCFELLKIKPDKRRIYNYYCGEDKILCTKCKEPCPDPAPTPISKTAFTVMAVGNVDNDPECDVWTINDAKVLKNVVVDP